MPKTLFDYDHYKAFLRDRAGPKTRRSGLKAKIAQALRCQPTYVSQVLHGSAQLSLEQADQLNRFFGHSEDESEYLLLLVQRERAGTPSLERFFAAKISELKSRRLVLTARLGTGQTLSKEDQSRYYSSWHYAAIHVALSIPSLRSPSALAEHFKIPLKKVTTVLEFLVQIGLASPQGGGDFGTGPSAVRLGNDSPNILRHHANWRQQAIDSLDREELSELHYSGVLTLSQKDAGRLKDRMLERLKEDLEIVKASPEEELFCYCIDFFQLKR